MKSLPLPLLGMLVVFGCNQQEGSLARQPSPQPTAEQPDRPISLAEARRGFQTKLLRRARPKGKLPTSRRPACFAWFATILRPGSWRPTLRPIPQNGGQKPAILWILGGFSNSIGEVWEDAPEDNDQTAAAYRRAGIVMMFPSLRGGNDNPGVKERFLGEVDDVLAAADYLAGLPYVDPERIYLGGHSTGGTLALLAAESSDRFRAVFSLGPAADPAGYGSQYVPFDTTSKRESELRAPIHWLPSIKSPVFVIEGAEGNIRSLEALRGASQNPLVHFLSVPGADHFSVIGPTNRLIAGKILRDVGAKTNLAVTVEELEKPFAP